MSSTSDLPRLYALLGDPVHHSRSPALHQAAFTALGLPHRYFALRVPPERLGAALVGARALGLAGLNLTIPHKQAALPHLDDLSPSAARIGAVNTVILRDDRLYGDNTDSPGFAAALGQLRARTPSAAIVLGAGGAARAVVDALLHQVGVDQIRWVSRAGLPPPHDPRIRALTYPQLAAGPLAADLLVHCTSVGMAGGPAELPIPLDLTTMPAGAAVLDLVYPRPSGGLLDRAEARGLAVQDGLETLLWQAVYAQERWQGRPLPAPVIEAMRAALR